MELFVWIIIAILLIWISLMGKLGSVLGAMIDPASMVDHSGSSSGGEF